MKFTELTPAEKRLVLAGILAKGDLRRQGNHDPDGEEVVNQILSVPTHYGMKLTEYFDLQHRRVVRVFDDFLFYVDTQMWTKAVTSSGTVAITAGINGILTLTGSTTQYSEALIKSTNADYVFTNNMPMVFECRLNYQETDTNNAAIFFGVTDSFATLLIANGGDVKSSFTGCGIYKISGSTVWKTVSSVTTTQNKNTSVTTTLQTATTPAGDQILRIAVNPISTTVAEITYFVNDSQLRATASPGTTYPIKDQYTFASTGLRTGFYVQNGSGATVTQPVNLDYICAENLRTGITG